MPSFGGTGGSIGAGLGAALGGTPANGSLGRYTAATDEGGPTYTDMEGNVIGLDAARGTWTGAQPVAPGVQPVAPGAGPAVPPPAQGGGGDAIDPATGLPLTPFQQATQQHEVEVDAITVPDNPFKPGSVEYYQDPNYQQYLPNSPGDDTDYYDWIKANPYMDKNLYSADALNTLAQRTYYDGYRDRPYEPRAVHAWNALYGTETIKALYGYAEGGVVRGYAQGGEIIPDEGLSGYEENLVQGAIAALTGQIENEADAKEILAEVEKVFGSGAVQELAGEIQAQEQAQPGGATGQQSLAHGGVAGGDGMDDSVQAKLTPGELVVSNPQLSDYGNGDRAVGAQKLQEHLANVSQAHRGSADTPQRVNPAALV
jgi:hypothetical protein